MLLIYMFSHENELLLPLFGATPGKIKIYTYTNVYIYIFQKNILKASRRASVDDILSSEYGFKNYF